MQRTDIWSELSWRHPVWELVRYFRALRGEKSKQLFLKELSGNKTLSLDHKTLPIQNEVIDLLFQYLDLEGELFQVAASDLRTEEDALAYCERSGFSVGKTKTQSKDHHQSSKAMIASVTGIAQKVCQEKGLEFDPDPQNRCVWLNDESLHITSRNLDGAIPGLANPIVIWEIKEYWGKTKGGSKMSDAVYECQLVGRELREYEEKCGISVIHAVFLDGKEQWSHRKSDLRRFIDLTYQGLVDHLIIGSQVEDEWEALLNKNI
ncbi:MAG: hypothetical protein AB2801_09730 [Candidatus Thiodiazotropha endolucinida]